MANIVERFEGDNIKTQHGGKGSVFFSVAGFSFGLTAEYSKALVKGGRIRREVEGKPNEKIGKNIAVMEKAQIAQKAAMSRAAGAHGK